MSSSRKDDSAFAKKRTITLSKIRPKMYGKSIFNFPNGDIYIGSYKLTPPDTLTMTGHGMYICSDGTVFRGDWERNEFIYGQIKFPSGEEYTGNLHRHLFHGEGVYLIPGVGRVFGNFRDHCPVEGLTLVDKDGQTWRAEVECCGAEFWQVNQFLEPTLFPKGQSFVARANPSEYNRPTVHSSVQLQRLPTQ